MGINLDPIIRAGDVEIQTRIKRFDVRWGRPHFAVTYKRLMLAKMPVFYWSMENLVQGNAHYSRNWGSQGRNYDLNYIGFDDIEWSNGVVDPTDEQVNFNGLGYGESLLTSANDRLSRGYSIVLWFSPSEVLNDGHVNGLLSKQTSFGNGLGGVCSVHIEGFAGANRLAFHFNNGEVYYTQASDVVFEVGKRYCVVLTVAPGGDLPDPSKPVSDDNPREWLDKNPMHIYVNGIEILNSTNYRNKPDFVTNNCKWLVGATRFNGTPVGKFNGFMDEVGVFPNVFNEFTAKQVFVVGLGATYLEPDEDFDNDVVAAYADQKKYIDLILSDNPVNYWTMDEVLAGGTGEYRYVEDSAGVGLYTKNLSVAQDSGDWNANRIVDGPLNDGNYDTTMPEPHALAFSGDSYPGIARNRQDFFSADVKAQTIEFWYMRRGSSSHYDGIVGLRTYGSKGFQISVQGSKIKAHFSFTGVSDNVKTLDTGSAITIERDIWYHIVATLNEHGEARLYVNGQLVASGSWGSTYAYQGPHLADLYVGGWGTDPNNTQPLFNLGHFAIYTSAISAGKVYSHYWTGKLGPYARITLTGGDPLQEPSPFVIGTNEYTELENEEDITEHVDSYSFDEDIKQLVSTASLTVYEDWGAQEINEKLNSNTYLRIERRYLSQSQEYDSGWLRFGDFLCEGPIGSSFQASGQRVFNVALKGLTKLFTLDLAHTPIEPDKLLVRKRKLDVSTATVDYTKFHMSRDPDVPTIENVFQNWAEFPSTKLWVTDFQNVGDEEDGGISDPKEVIRIKGSEGAVRILGGEGAVVIDNTYLLDKITDNGLGDPATLMAEFYRYATVEDKVVTQVTSMEVVNNRWIIGLDSPGALIDGKTFWVRSGSAKGKLWKLVAIGSDRTFYPFEKIDADTSISNTGSATHNWTKVSTYNNAPPPPGGGTQYAAQALGPTGALSVRWDFNYLNIPVEANVPASASGWSDDSRVTGIKITIWRRSRTNTGQPVSLFFSQVIEDIGVKLKVGSLTTTETARNGFWEPGSTAWASFVYGGERQTLGANWTWGMIKDSLDDIAVQYAVNIQALNSTSVRAIAEVYQVKVEIGVEDLGVVTLHDIHGYPVHPEYEGLAVGDTVQIGDYNAVDDAYRKAAYRAGFQENDSTKPFYFEFDPCPTELAPSVPPLRPKISDETYWAEIVEEIGKYAPPNYRMYVDAEGVTRAKLQGFLIGALPSHQIVGRLDINEDRGDYGIATRLIVEGEGSDTFNIGLNVAYGGTSAVRAYVLEGYANPDSSPNSSDDLGIDLTQAEADAKWQQVFNGNPKTPVPNEDDWKNYYGVLLAREHSPEYVKRWDFEDTPLCGIDLGRSSSGTPIEIEALEFTWMNHYLEGNTIAQSLIIHYMTEAAYEAEYGNSLPATPDQDDMSYFPSASSRAWELLVDEFALSEGNTTIEANDFEGSEPKQVRFLKITCGQGHYRFPVKVDGGDRDAAIRVSLAECKIWTSKRIIATAELGVSGIFGSGDYKELATRLRRRTDYLEKNLYLNDYFKAKTFALEELQERYVDFTPISVTAFAPTVQVGEIVYLVHPETRVGKTYLVIAGSHDRTGIVKMQVLNYDIPT